MSHDHPIHPQPTSQPLLAIIYSFTTTLKLLIDQSLFAIFLD